MSEQKFKKGDRVRGERSGVLGTAPRGTWIEGVVQEGTALTKPHELRIRVDDGGDFYIYADTARSLTYTPQVGDKVRLVHEGTVTDVTGFAAGKSVVIDGYARLLGKGETVELLEKAPEPEPSYAVGTVAISQHAKHTPAVRQKDGSWWPEHQWSHLDDKLVRENPFFDVIHEPPTS